MAHSSLPEGVSPEVYTTLVCLPPPREVPSLPYIRLLQSPGYTTWTSSTKLTVRCTGQMTGLTEGLYLRGWFLRNRQKGVF